MCCCSKRQEIRVYRNFLPKGDSATRNFYLMHSANFVTILIKGPQDQIKDIKMITPDSVCRNLLIILLTLLAIVSFPLSILLLPVYAWRWFISLLAPIMRKDLGKMLSARSNLFAVELSEMFSIRTRYPLYVSLVVDNFLHIDAFRQFFLEKSVNQRLPNGELRSPELQQTITSWCGYLFWQWDENFNIENHIKIYDGPWKPEHMTDEDLPEIANELCQPFRKGQSPWEIWMWNDARLVRDPQQKPKTIWVFRIHHSLADGYSILRLLAEDIATQDCPMPLSIERPRFSMTQKMFKLMKVAILGPFELISMSINAWDINEWHISEKKLTSRLNTAMTTAIPVKDVKEIKEMYGMGFNAALQVAFTGAMRNFMLEHNIRIPAKIHCMIPLPMPGHSGKLRNHMTAVMVPLPVGIADTRERIRSVKKSFDQLQKSNAPAATFLLLPFVGALPAWVIRILAKNLICTCLMTNFPAPANQHYIMGQELDDIVFGGGLMVGNTGIGLSSLSYNGNIRFGAGIDEGIFQDPEEVRSLVRKIVEELNVLRGLEIV